MPRGIPKKKYLRRITPLEIRFWRAVKHGVGCWEWKKSLRNGYGVIGLGRADEGIEYAHRISYTICVGPIPDGLCVLHRCDNRMCVRPDHLFLGTRADNNHDMQSKGRHWSQNRKPK